MNFWVFVICMAAGVCVSTVCGCCFRKLELEREVEAQKAQAPKQQPNPAATAPEISAKLMKGNSDRSYPRVYVPDDMV